MNRPDYDVVVIGGGIHGVGAAQAAAAAGLRVLLLEKTALAAGTSSRSSKLVHGGLRYLETGQLRLVRECLKERALLLRLAPDLVKLRPFRFPVYRNSRRPPWQLHLGLGAYAALGGFRAANVFHKVPAARWRDLDGLATRGLLAVYEYQDAQTDDVALTRAVWESAAGLGAQQVLPARVTNIQLLEHACRVTYTEGNGEAHCQTRTVINAAGPWINQVLAMTTPAVAACDVELVQGTHVILDETLSDACYYLEAPQDGRAVFVMPWEGRTLVGTTETPFAGNPDTVAPLAEEQDYLLEVVRHYFPEFSPEPVDAFAGLRVLPAGTGAAFRRSRETVFAVDRPDRPRLLSIVGGKLTSYRLTALKALARLAASLPTKTPRADTGFLPLLPPE